MTKEELEKEAIAKYKTGSYPQLHPDHYAFIHGYLAGAEPREKRIAELEELLINSKNLSDTIEKAQKKKIAELEKDVKLLGERCNQLLADKGKLTDELDKWKAEWNDQVIKSNEEGFNAGKPQWHKLDWKKDFPDVDKLVRVRTKSDEEYICQTYLYYPTEDEIGYGSAIIQFEELNGDWVDDNEIEYWCEIPTFDKE